MKKYLMFMLAAALFASCSDDEKLPKEEMTKHQVILILRNMMDILSIMERLIKQLNLLTERLGWQNHYVMCRKDIRRQVIRQLILIFGIRTN